VRNWLGVVAAVVVVGCGSGGSADDGGDDGDDTVADDGGGDDGGDDAPVDGPPVDPTPYCQTGCAVPADCAAGPPGGTADVDNYACVDEVCAWTGCNSTAECVATLGDPDSACEIAFGTLVPTCWQTCDLAADCASPGGNVVFDADNYECTGGLCQWTGCNSNAECAAGIPSAPICAVPPHGQVIPTCLQACDTPADCASPSAPFDADNYACDGGACIYEGCNSTAECASIDPDLVCAPTPTA
jgi:hypothetical protein